MTVADKAARASEHPSIELLARAGLVAYGIVHLLIGWLALQIAWGGSRRSADAAGALSTVATQPFGKVLLWLVAVGLVALAVWQAGEAVWGNRQRERGERLLKQVRHTARAVVYVALGVSAASIALGSGSSSSSQSQREATAGVLGWPGGRAIVLAAGLVIVAVGVAHVVKAVRKSYLDDMDRGAMSRATVETVSRLGAIGYVAKGVALGVVGGLLTYATATFDRQRAGLDGALETIAAQPFGKFLVTAVAAGFVAFGLFAMLQSRYRRM